MFIDFSITKTGYTIALGQDIYLTRCVRKKAKTTKRPAETNDEYVLRLYYEIVNDILSIQSRDNELTVIIENSFGGKSQSTAQKLPYYRGMLLGLLKPSFFSDPLASQWRKPLGFNQAQDKKAVAIQTGQDLKGISQEDECESFCIALSLGCRWRNLTYTDYLLNKRIGRLS